MRLVTVSGPEGPRAGVVRDDGVVALEVLGHHTVASLVEAGPAEWSRVADAAVSAATSWALDDYPLLAPIPRPPRNAFAVGANYATHFDEGIRPAGSSIPEIPVFFTKPWTSFVGHEAEVAIDRAATQRVDWEAEIAVVIGVAGVNIPLERAMEHVFGYCLANDVSARDLQLAGGAFAQWFKGKSLDGFGPLGPWITTVDEVGDPAAIDVRLTVNGAMKQEFTSAGMYHDVSAIIARLSLGMRLLPGDVILTGTSAGVGHWRDPQEFLSGGDVVEITSSVLGTLRTRFTEPG